MSRPANRRAACACRCARRPTGRSRSLTSSRPAAGQLEAADRGRRGGVGCVTTVAHPAARTRARRAAVALARRRRVTATASRRDPHAAGPAARAVAARPAACAAATVWPRPLARRDRVRQRRSRAARARGVARRVIAPPPARAQRVERAAQARVDGPAREVEHRARSPRRVAEQVTQDDDGAVLGPRSASAATMSSPTSAACVGRGALRAARRRRSRGAARGRATSRSRG